MGATAGAACGGDWGELPWAELKTRLRDRAAWAAMTGHHRTRRGGRGFAPWAPGPWSGFWGGPPWAQREPGGGRPRAAKGNVRTAILALLAEEPRHGYQLMQDIAERSHGAWRPSPGSVYPVLSALQDEGLVDDEKVEGRRVFSLTAAGRAHVAERADELGAVFDAYDAAARDDEELGTADARALIAGVAAAAVQVFATGTDEQVAAARQLLDRARRELYGLLAQDSDEEEQS